ncbi:MAG: hypothetical protein JSS32_08325 [Verrucomicrobia bacterium]|nr:hypothetical protein [Verrucomicrobiota bacterium]
MSITPAKLEVSNRSAFTQVRPKSASPTHPVAALALRSQSDSTVRFVPLSQLQYARTEFNPSETAARQFQACAVRSPSAALVRSGVALSAEEVKKVQSLVNVKFPNLEQLFTSMLNRESNYLHIDAELDMIQNDKILGPYYTHLGRALSASVLGCHVIQSGLVDGAQNLPAEIANGILDYISEIPLVGLAARPLQAIISGADMVVTCRFVEKVSYRFPMLSKISDEIDQIARGFTLAQANELRQMENQPNILNRALGSLLQDQTYTSPQAKKAADDCEKILGILRDGEKSSTSPTVEEFLKMVTGKEPSSQRIALPSISPAAAAEPKFESDMKQPTKADLQKIQAQLSEHEKRIQRIEPPKGFNVDVGGGLLQVYLPGGSSAEQAAESRQVQLERQVNEQAAELAALKEQIEQLSQQDKNGQKKPTDCCSVM